MALSIEVASTDISLKKGANQTGGVSFQANTKDRLVDLRVHLLYRNYNIIEVPALKYLNAEIPVEEDNH